MDKHIRYALFTNCAVERNFSLFDLLNYKRTNSTEANFKKIPTNNMQFQ